MIIPARRRTGAWLLVASVLNLGAVGACSPMAIHPIWEGTLCELAFEDSGLRYPDQPTLTDCETVAEWTLTATSVRGGEATEIGALVRLTLLCSDPQHQDTAVCLDFTTD